MLSSLLRLVPKSTRISVSSKPLEPTAVTRSSKGFQLRLRVKPNSTTDRILNLRKDCLDIAVTQAAQKDEANRGVIDLMSMVKPFFASYLRLDPILHVDRFSLSERAKFPSWQAKRVAIKPCLYVYRDALRMNTGRMMIWLK